MNSKPVLSQILEATRKRIEEAKRVETHEALRARALASRVPHPFRAALFPAEFPVIAEIKRASPSGGSIRPDSDPVEIAGAYLKGGASALSILTEPEFFDGSLEVLSKVRAAFPEAALLRKDFIVDPYQIAEARLHGADAVLLIVAALKDPELHALQAEARALGLETLVEVHNFAEWTRAIYSGARLIGFNHRDLKSMRVDFAFSKEVLQVPRPQGTMLVAESGITNASHLRELKNAGFDAFLVGTALMRAKNPGIALEQWLLEASEK